MIESKNLEERNPKEVIFEKLEEELISQDS